MRRSIKSLLSTLVVLACAGTASAYTLTAVEASSGSGAGGSYLEGETLEVDILMDTGSDLQYGFITYVGFYVDVDPGALLPNESLSTRTPVPGETYGSLYLYANSLGWYISSTAWAAVGPFSDLVIATLVFDVLDVAATVNISPNFDGPVGAWMGGEGTDVSDQATLNPLTIYTAPEPAVLALVLSAIGTLAFLRTGRSRVR